MASRSQQQDTHADLETLVEQEHQNSGDISGQQKLGGRAQSSQAPSPRPPKTPKKKFHWFKGLKENLTKYTPSLSKVVQPLSTTVSNTDQSANSSMESTGAVDEGVTQGDEMDTKLSRMMSDAEEPHPRETEVPPKPKRNAPRTKTAETIIISPEPQAETLVLSENQPDENSCPSPTQRKSTTQKGSSHELHAPEIKLLPVDLSTSVSSDSTDDRTRSYSAPSPTMKKQLRNNRKSLPPTGDHTEGKEKGRTQPNIIPKRYRPHSGGHMSPALPTTSRGRGLSKHISGSTPHLTPAKLARAKWSSSVSHLACNERSGPKPSISDLIKPTALASRSRSSQGCVDAATQSSGDQHFGILKVRLKALDTSENFQSQSSSSQIELVKATKEGLRCVFTIGGGNGRFTSSVQPLIPHRTTTWNDEEVIFYVTPHSRKLFVLCQKTRLQSTTATGSPTESKSSKHILKLQEDRCIGAAVLEISAVEIRSCSPTNNICDYLAHIGSDDHKLPVQPKGIVLLQSSLCGRYSPCLVFIHVVHIF